MELTEEEQRVFRENLSKQFKQLGEPSEISDISPQPSQRNERVKNKKRQLEESSRVFNNTPIIIRDSKKVTSETDHVLPSIIPNVDSYFDAYRVPEEVRTEPIYAHDVLFESISNNREWVLKIPNKRLAEDGNIVYGPLSIFVNVREVAQIKSMIGSISFACMKNIPQSNNFIVSYNVKRHYQITPTYIAAFTSNIHTKAFITTPLSIAPDDDIYHTLFVANTNTAGHYEDRPIRSFRKVFIGSGDTIELTIIQKAVNRIEDKKEQNNKEFIFGKDNINTKDNEDDSIGIIITGSQTLWMLK